MDESYTTYTTHALNMLKAWKEHFRILELYLWNHMSWLYWVLQLDGAICQALKPEIVACGWFVFVWFLCVCPAQLIICLSSMCIFVFQFFGEEDSVCGSDPEERWGVNSWTGTKPEELPFSWWTGSCGQNQICIPKCYPLINCNKISSFLTLHTWKGL